MNLSGKYPGSKARQTPIVEPLYPPHRHFVALFGGIGAEIMCRRGRSYLETFNDKSHVVTNYFRVIQDDRSLDQLCDQLWRYGYHQSTFYAARARLRYSYNYLSAVERARDFLLITNLSNGMNAGLNGIFSLNYKCSKDPDRWLRIERTIRAVARRFAAVQVINDDWEWVLDRTDSPDTLFSADPPYLSSTLTTTSPMYGIHMTEADHERLLRRLVRCRSSWFLYGYDSALYRRYLRGVTRVVCDVPCSMGLGPRRSRRQECVWFRYARRRSV